MSDKTIARIAALLNKADNTDNEHEADAFLKAAQRIATLESIDLAKARAHTRSKESTTPEQREIVIGERRQRGLTTLIELFLEIAAANDVRVAVAHNNTLVYAHGYRDDIDVVQALYVRLLPQMAAASRAFLARGDYQREEVPYSVLVRDRGTGAQVWETRYKPMATITARLEFQVGFARRIGQRLWEARRDAEAESRATDPIDPGQGASTELVLADKRKAVADYYKKYSNTGRRTHRGYRPNTVSFVSRDAGDRAGQRAKLGADTEIAHAKAALSA
ncbi:DUF2786 domain-containing protein [Mycobacteroides abscessus]|uniref:DUF2786 domain-containing protein n=1 Tax=Mycobacteroides abscessus TaxID=36809 RepID=UPI00092BA122|nr:DUF2786 domain-containing protein [Mycobacteroides abscessus]SIE00314.1 Protein of uncharacterised function (DUF2786) [Mycobacteroides abscessus subsp. abscessus]SKV99592.1 Protein of uncharacterised function (DUF2786) [Mycobacteroides abscessus subsp. abscessus]SKW39624.1 Protein of uncharacterised function (DUF2786) [Mycobacteroides abscessus subsp. abscessus]